MAAVEHPRPTAASNAEVRVFFDIEDKSLGDAEALWGRHLTRETVQVDNIPLLVFGVSMGDVVRVRREDRHLRFAGVAERGGHSTYRVMLDSADDDSVQEQLRSIIVMGCGYEQLTSRFLALDVPPEVDVYKVYALLERGLEEGAWTFEEGHCGHPVER